jgi:signal transduction histidine kinase/ligand-binding sensor domain-containing protein
MDRVASLGAGWLILLVLGGAPAAVQASGGDLHFERIGTESGPPPEVITSIYQDRAGFIWIGSRDGLALYDGYTFTVFEHDASDPTSISDNTIRTIYEDSQGNLWLGTNTGGLNRLDRATWQFEHFRHDSADSSSISHDSVYAILEDRTGALWVGTQLGLNRFDPETRRFERFFSDPGDPESLSHDYVYALHEDPDGGLWITTVGGGLNYRDPETGAFTVYRNDPGDPTSLSYDNALAISDGPQGGLWVATGEGLNLLDRETGTFRRVGRDPDRGPMLSDPLVPAMAPGPAGKLWIATHGGGLNQLDPATGEIRFWKHDPSKRNSLGSDEVIALLSDATEGLWIGTWGGGLNRLSPRSLLLSESAHLARMPEDLDVNDVTALMIDGAGGIWLGTRSGDVVRRDVDRMTDRHYLRGGDKGTPRIILGFAEDRSGKIWIATNGGILRLDPETGGQISHHHDQEDPTSLGPGYVKGILVDRAGRLWVGTGEGGVQRLDADGRVLARFVHDASDPGSLSDNYVTTLVEDSRGTLWVGTRSGGLNALDPQTGRIVRHLPEAGDSGTLSHHYVTSIIEDSSGTLWVGTGGGGLNRVGRLEGGSLHFTRFTGAGGLIDDDVMGIQEDDDGSLWISTKRGLTRFDPGTGSFANLNVADGLPSGEFEPATVARNESTLYFGTVKGLVAVPTGTQFPNPSASPTVITTIRTSSGTLATEHPVWDLHNLEMPWGEWLSLQFAVLDYSVDRRHRYQYRLGGVDEDWIDLGSSREITFTDLDPGAYEFNVRGRNSQGVWSIAEPTLQIEIVPPFWMTMWFRAAVALFVISMVIVGHRVRVNAVEKRNRELVALYRQRERARRELGEAYERLTRLTRSLEAAKEDERRTIARELHDELGPSLTAVIINLQLLAEDRDPGRRSRRIQDTIGLADRLVDRVRDLSLDLRPPLLDELGLVPALKGYLEAQASRAGIEIDVVEEVPTDELPPETEITAFRVVQEAVTNVIRHADAVQVLVTVRQVGGGLELAVKDDGVGFDLHATMERAAAGKAIGLLGMQERVRMLGGEIQIESWPGRGTQIRVNLPIAVLS